LFLQARTLYVQVVWAGVQAYWAPSGFDPSTAYLQSVETTTYPDKTGELGAGFQYEQQIITLTYNLYTGECIGSTSWSSTQANFIARAAAGPGGVTGSVIASTNTEYAVNWINATTGEVFWTDVTILSGANPLSAANAMCADLFASYTVTEIPWNQTWVVYQDSSGDPQINIGANGGSTGMVAMYQPLDTSGCPSGNPCSVPTGPIPPGTPLADIIYEPENFCVLAAGAIRANMSWWIYDLPDWGDPTASECSYTCVSSGAGITTKSYSTPGAQVSTVWLAYDTDYFPNTVPSPCDGSPPPTC
jgi:hypothetical protein